MKNNRGKSRGLLFFVLAALALYALSGIIPVIAGIIVWAMPLLLIGIVVLIIAIVVSSLKQSEKEGSKGPKKKAQENGVRAMTPDERQALADARASVVQIRTLGAKIDNAEIRSQSADICKLLDEILKALKEDPSDIHGARRVLSYYIPSLTEILRKFDKLETSNTASAEMPAKVTASLTEIKEALEKLYKNLFANDSLDLSVEMKAMSLALKRDGLVPEDFSAPIEEAAPAVQEETKEEENEKTLVQVPY